MLWVVARKMGEAVGEAEREKEWERCWVASTE